MNKLFLFSIGIFLSFQTHAARNIILVPGFFNSLIPAPQNGGGPFKQPYFSHDIVDSLAQFGDRVWVVDNLSPVAGIQENGERLIQFLQQHLSEMENIGDMRASVVIAHSAGGLYALYAAAHSALPISHIITLSTPFRGLRFLQTLKEGHIPIETITAPFCLENLFGLLEVSVQEYLSQLQLRYPLRLDVFAGYQTMGINVWNYHVLSTPLVVFQALTGEASDGIVTVKSSLDTSALVAKNPALQIVTHPQTLDLEHWELIADPAIFNMLGVKNTGSLVRDRAQIYQGILKASGM